MLLTQVIPVEACGRCAVKIPWGTIPFVSAVKVCRAIGRAKVATVRTWVGGVDKLSEEFQAQISEIIAAARTILDVASGERDRIRRRAERAVRERQARLEHQREEARLAELAAMISEDQDDGYVITGQVFSPTAEAGFEACLRLS